MTTMDLAGLYAGAVFGEYELTLIIAHGQQNYNVIIKNYDIGWHRPIKLMRSNEISNNTASIKSNFGYGY